MEDKAANIEAEKELATLLQANDETVVMEWLDSPQATQVEFTGRTFCLAITQGMKNAALRMGKLGFHLAVTDDAAAIRAIEQAASMRGLLSFLNDYRYCKAQRTYYLPVVESADSLKPICALQKAGYLSSRDASELLSLSLRMDNPKLARALVEGGAQLQDDIRQNTPTELREANNISMENTGSHWAEMVTPQRSLETLQLIFEQIGNMPVRIHKNWWGAYKRRDGFTAKLAAIATRSNVEHCDDVELLMTTLAQAGEAKGLRTVCDWDNLEVSWLDTALAAARDAGNTETAAIVMRARQNLHKPSTEALDLLDF